VMARFRHPHAVRLLGGKLDDPAGPCILMEYAGGIELAELLQLHRRLDPDRMGRLLVPICQALNAAHAAGIIHRDLKPSNIKIQDPNEETETATVMDLGLAALAYKPYIPADKLRGYHEVHLIGSPAYICPEQVRGDNTDHRADIYSLGVLIFEALTGRLPFEDQQIEPLLKAHNERPPPTFAEVGLEEVSPKIEDVVRMCLEKYPNERPQSAFEVVQRYLDAMGSYETLNEADFAPQDAAGMINVPPVGTTTHQIVHSITAWMPEAIAIIKLRGLMRDLGAQLLESRPGLIRFQFGNVAKPDTSSGGLMNWIRKTTGSGSKPRPCPPIAIDLHLTKQPGVVNQLEITIVFRTVEGPLPEDPRWHKRVNYVFGELQAYLIAQR
jgi:serine/threonine protein kinase